MWGAIAGMAANSLASYYGQKEANQMQRDSAREATWASAEEAEKNRAWQEQMSNTSHQRAKADLEQAGLNPLLSATQTGASTPGGGQGSGFASSAGNALGQGAASALEARRLFADLKKQKAELNQVEKQGKLTDALANESRTKAKALGYDAAKGEAAQSFWRTIKEKWNQATSPLSGFNMKKNNDSLEQLGRQKAIKMKGKK